MRRTRARAQSGLRVGWLGSTAPRLEELGSSGSYCWSHGSYPGGCRGIQSLLTYWCELVMSRLQPGGPGSVRHEATAVRRTGPRSRQLLNRLGRRVPGRVDARRRSAGPALGKQDRPRSIRERISSSPPSATASVPASAISIPSDLLHPRSPFVTAHHP